MNNKTLGLIFGALVVIFLLTKWLSAPKDRSFDPEIIELDTAKVNELIVNKPGETSFTLQKVGNAWSLNQGDKNYSPTESSINGLLTNLSSIVADRIVTKNPDRWKEYNVDDSTGTRIQALQDGKVIGDVVVGRFNFNQATRNGISYLKQYGEDEVYAVQGFLSMSLTQGFDNYRDKSIVSLNKNDLTRFTLEQQNARMVISKIGNEWKDDQEISIDSAKMESFLNNIQSVSGITFANEPERQKGSLLQNLIIEGNNMSAPVQVECYTSLDTTHAFFIQSSLNADASFFSDSSGVYDRVFQKLVDLKSN